MTGVNNKIAKLINLEAEGTPTYSIDERKRLSWFRQDFPAPLQLRPHPRRMHFVREHLSHAHTMKARGDRGHAIARGGGIYFWIMQRRLSSAIGEKEIRPLYATRGNFVRWNYFPFLFRCEIAPRLIGIRRSPEPSLWNYFKILTTNPSLTCWFWRKHNDM